ncbi:MAG: LPS assembly lipoprotein LptE [Deltaproteobacteria bacterium]|jgi:hypothetical protein|nr:LPS assembly lipoprotein LptE [Deltaproteobacteria bacterium]
MNLFFKTGLFFRKTLSFKTLPAIILTVLSGCGYSLNPTSYRLAEPLTLSVPVADNSSRYGHLGPELTRAVIARLSGTPGLVIDSRGADSSLKMTITQVVVGSGSWDIVRTHDDETPEASSSRTVSVTVDVNFTRPGKNSIDPPLSNRMKFSSSRTYLVSQIQGQVEMQEAEALTWIMEDLAQKIGLVMFNEF